MNKRPMDILPPTPKPASQIHEVDLSKPIETPKKHARKSFLSGYLAILLVTIFAFLFQLWQNPGANPWNNAVAMLKPQTTRILGASDTNLSAINQQNTSDAEEIDLTKTYKIDVLNGSDKENIDSILNYIKEANFEINSVSKTPEIYLETTIRYRAGELDKAEKLAQLIATDLPNLEESTDVSPDLDLVLVLGIN